MLTIEELRQKESDFRSRLAQVEEFLKIEDKEAELAALEEKMNALDFWDDKDAAQSTIAAVSSCRNIITPFRKMEGTLDDFGTALEFAAEDEAFVAEAEAQLPALEAEEADHDHAVTIENVEDEHFITVHHPMTKAHYISFVAFVTSDRIQMVKLYPEGNAQTRLQLRGTGYLYFCCNQHGLFRKKM